MYSFELHFTQNGDVVVDHIKGILPGSNECLDLTKPYEDTLGVPVIRNMEQGESNYININLQDEENA